MGDEVEIPFETDDNAKVVFMTPPGWCGQNPQGPHVCSLTDCPKDDPDHMHQCYQNDFDWTAGEYEKYRLGLIDEQQFVDTAHHRALERRAERERAAQERAQRLMEGIAARTKTFWETPELAAQYRWEMGAPPTQDTL